LSRLESSAEMAFTTVDLRAIVREAVARQERLVRSRGPLVRCCVPEAAVVVTGHADTLRSAVSNLIENAIHYSRDEHEPIEVELHADEGAADIIVRDRGIGIAPSERERIFDRFYRGDAAVQHAHGTGLGLAIVKSAVKAHGGRVDVSTRPGGGSVFTISLPRKVVRQAGLNPGLARGPA